MKTVSVKIVDSFQHADLLSIRGRDGHVGSFKKELVEAGFLEGEDAVIVDRKSFEELKVLRGAGS